MGKHQKEGCIMKGLSLRFLFAFIICVGLAVLFSNLAAAIGNESMEHFDLAVINFVQGMEMPWLTPIMKVFTWIGSGYVVAPITIIAFILLFFIYRYRQQAFLLVTVILGTVILNSLLKIYFKRDRPEIYRILDATGFSFPSGHTMMAFSLYTIIAYILWRNIRTTLNHILLILFTTFMIIMISTSRIYLGVHYPSDIVGGFMVSALWLIIVIAVYGYYQNRRENKENRESV